MAMHSKSEKTDTSVANDHYIADQTIADKKKKPSSGIAKQIHDQMEIKKDNLGDDYNEGELAKEIGKGVEKEVKGSTIKAHSKQKRSPPTKAADMPND